ncbi:MarR family transcriptional regulator [Rhizobium sp. RU36D]|uniref:MarR family winged helix-turn-helix transcriptional regulator n=1 Tax=Rhizobium sp. RU36D TaxID=1907415 RepID=UPI0009D8B521|nr:MarR family transcriptional regulator [Rhizobium sp. RU36D]SMC87419.1 DNA-binding transcriptional regulator, MarR family [Rhizobium sp. RU36D]
MADDTKDEVAGADAWVMQRPRAIFYLNQANHAVRSRLEAALASQQITSIQYTVLSVISSRDGLSSAELSRRFFVAPQTMNELIGGLLRRNLIIRKEDPDNRRILRMSLTPEGKRMMKACDAAADAAEKDVFSFLPQETYQQFRDLCRLIARELRERDEAARQE